MAPSAAANFTWAGTTLLCTAGLPHSSSEVFALSKHSELARQIHESGLSRLMCGICGQYNFTSQAPIERRDLEKMTRTMVHRGPDDEGYHFDGPLGFGFRRLSIIDLEGGHQPMSDQEEAVWVVFNGEIYNFPELKKQL